MIPRLWGVPPPPSAGDGPRPGIATVRNPDSPFWIGNLRNSEFRCLVPATAFMEWGEGMDAAGKRRATGSPAPTSLCSLLRACGRTARCRASRC